MQMKLVAAREGITMSELANRAVIEFFDQNQSKSPEELKALTANNKSGPSVFVYVDKGTHAKIKQLSITSGITLSSLVGAAVEFYLEKLVAKPIDAREF